MRWFYAAWCGLISALIVLQLYLAGYGVFGFNGASGFGAHGLVGDLIFLAILIGCGLSFAARVPGRPRWPSSALTRINFALVVLMLVQVMLAWSGVRGISALHVVNGVLIFAVALYLTREAWKVAKLEEVPAPGLQAVPAAKAVKT